MRKIKFRAWDKNKKTMRNVTGINWYDEHMWVDETPMSGDKLSIEGTPLMQFTGLLDKNGKEIYELMEIDKKFRIVYQAPKYVLQEISSGDIIDIYEQPEVTGEYSPI